VTNVEALSSLKIFSLKQQDGSFTGGANHVITSARLSNPTQTPKTPFMVSFFICVSSFGVRSLSIMAEPKWKRFEKHIHQIHAQLIPSGAKIKYDDSIMGFDSGVERQIEITIRFRLANYDMLLVIDCKDYAEPIHVVDMGAFKSLASDVRANKAVMISTNGYTPAAITMARNAGIETRTYLDTESAIWPSVVSIPVLISNVRLDAWNVTFSSVPGYPFGGPVQELKQDVPLIETFDIDGKPLGPILVLLGKKWHQNESLPAPGEHTVTIADHVIIKEGPNDIHTKIDAHLHISHHHFLGPMGIKVEGFRDDQNDSLITKKIETENLDFVRIARGEMPGWNEIPNKENLAVKVMMTMVTGTAFPESIEEMKKMMSPEPAA
jgi:Restriction endonuclease